MNRSQSVIAVAAFALVAACHGSDTQGKEAPDDNTPVEHANIPPKVAPGCGIVYSIHYGDAMKTLKDAEEYRPKLRTYYVRELSDNRNEFLLAAISPKFRDDWFGSHKSDEKGKQCMKPVIDALGEAAKRTLPKYRPRGYVHHDDDKLIEKEVKKEFPDAKFIETGVSSDSWEIEKLRNGIPSSRYKYGMAWFKSASIDDGYCRIAYVNVFQDYTGGGNFGDTKPNYLKVEPAGCNK